MSSEKSKYPLSSGKGELNRQTGREREKGDKEMKSERDRVEEREKEKHGKRLYCTASSLLSVPSCLTWTVVLATLTARSLAGYQISSSTGHRALARHM